MAVFTAASTTWDGYEALAKATLGTTYIVKGVRGSVNFEDPPADAGLSDYTYPAHVVKFERTTQRLKITAQFDNLSPAVTLKSFIIVIAPSDDLSNEVALFCATVEGGADVLPVTTTKVPVGRRIAFDIYFPGALTYIAG